MNNLLWPKQKDKKIENNNIKLTIKTCFGFIYLNHDKDFPPMFF